MDGWLLGHATFVVPIAFALYRVDTNASRLAADRDTLRLMVRATRQAFKALQTSGNAEIPANLRTFTSGYSWNPPLPGEDSHSGASCGTQRVADGFCRIGVRPNPRSGAGADRVRLGLPRALIDAMWPTFKTSSGQGTGRGSRWVGGASAVNGLVRLGRTRNANSMASCWFGRAPTGCWVQTSTGRS